MTWHCFRETYRSSNLFTMWHSLMILLSCKVFLTLRLSLELMVRGVLLTWHLSRELVVHEVLLDTYLASRDVLPTWHLSRALWFCKVLLTCHLSREIVVPRVTADVAPASRNCGFTSYCWCGTCLGSLLNNKPLLTWKHRPTKQSFREITCFVLTLSRKLSIFSHITWPHCFHKLRYLAK